jgi:hypothetical protein
MPVIVDNLAAGKKFEHGNPGFRANTTAANCASDFLMDGGVTAAYWFGELAPQ